MRVIAGKYRSRVLRPLPGMDIRPTADRLRETLLNVLTAGNPNALEGTTWIDLFAGTGAVGIEAISRGAAKVQFVESSAAAVSVIRQNLKSLGIDSGFEVLQQDAARALPKLRGLPADFVFLDPPYRLDAEYKQTLALLAESPLVTEKTIIVAEHHKRSDPGDEIGRLKRYRRLTQGDAALSFYRL